MKTKMIRLTKRSIRDGKLESSTACPVALQLRKAGLIHCWVEPDHIIPDSNNWESWPLPVRVKRWIKRFDAGKPVKPFSFRMPAKFFTP